MTLNRVPKNMRKDILNLQKYYELTRRMKDNDRYHYWESHRRSNLYFKTLGFTMEINNVLEPMEKDVFHMRYIFKYPIMKIVQQTGYSKRMIQYKLNDIIIKLNEGIVLYREIKKYKLQQYVIKSYTAPSTPKKVQ